MRHTLFILMLLISTTMAAQTEMFEKYEDTKGVKTVFISKSVLKLLPDINVGVKKLSNTANRLDAVQILECAEAKQAEIIEKDFRNYITNNHFEVVIKANDEDEKITIYQKNLKHEKTCFVLINREGRTLNIIAITGKISIDELKNYM